MAVMKIRKAAPKDSKGITKAKKHTIKRWEVSIIEFKNHERKSYKVTRRLPELSVAETKIFKSKKEAKQQFNEWLN